MEIQETFWGVLLCGMHGCVNVHGCVYMPMWLCAYGDQIIFFHIFLTEAFYWLGWMACELQGYGFLWLSSAGVTDWATTQVFVTRVSEI